jgi:hypothetical protein
MLHDTLIYKDATDRRLDISASDLVVYAHLAQPVRAN